jgi:hypothetical protein
MLYIPGIATGYIDMLSILTVLFIIGVIYRGIRETR